MKEIKVQDAVGQILCHDITQIVRGVIKDAKFRKGHVITEEDIPELLKLAGSMTIAVYEHPPCQWMDVGTVEKLAVASQFLQNALD